MGLHKLSRLLLKEGVNIFFATDSMLMCSGFRLKVCFCGHCFNSSLWILKLIIQCLFVSFTVYSNCFVVLFLRFVKLWRLVKLMQGPFDIFIVYMLISEWLVFVCNVQRKRERKKQCPAVYLLQFVQKNTEEKEKLEETNEEEEGWTFTSQRIKTSKYREYC